ncbi:hypothetical protein AGMMS49938_16710 [Fibrobacterales bacterium]|nr:hypothetical protein AGMMS49938_16710 [Fibrobacterales bacterium]
MDWYYIDKNKTEGKRRSGPWSARQMLCFAEQGAFEPNTLVWCEKLTEWKAWSECESELNAEIQANTIKQLIEVGMSNRLRVEDRETLVVERDRLIAKRSSFYASLWQRTCAFLIDSFILQIVLVLLKPLYPELGFISQVTEQTTLSDLAPMLFFMYNMMLFYDAFFVKNFSGTPGKILMRISVVRRGGKQMTWACAFVRAFTGIFSSSLFGIGCLLAVFDPEKRALHDFAADTRVIKL